MTQELLKEILHYNQDTGAFTWKTHVNNNNGHKNSLAGRINDAGYLLITYKRKTYRAHRLAWLYVYGEMPTYEIDHINHIRDDNRIANLRQATRLDQTKNMSMRSDNKTGVTGVIHRPDRNKQWQVRITVNKNRITVGSYDTKNEAIIARKDAEKRYGFHYNHGKALDL